jgi:hypothetical protein
MAEKIIIEYEANVSGLKADLKTVQTELKTTETTAKTAADTTTTAFNKTTESTKSLKTQLKELKAQLANATDPKDIEKLARAAGKLTDQIEDATDAAKVFASESKFEQIGNAFGSVVSKLRNLDFSGAVAQSKLLVATSKSLTFKEALGGVKDLGATLLNVGKSLLMNPIFLIGAAVTGIIANFDKLKNSGGIVGKTFTTIGEIIGGVVDGITDFANAIGLVDTETGKFYDNLIEKSNKTAKLQADTIDRIIKLRQAEGKSTVDAEILKQEQIRNTARIEFEILAKRKKATGELSEDEQKRLKESIDAQANALYEIDLIRAKANAEKIKKDAETNKKLIDEANALNKALRDLTTQNIQGNYAREKQLLDNKLADDIEKYKGNAKIREQLEIKYQNDLKALDKKFVEDWYDAKMPAIEKGEQDIADIRIQETIRANNAILAKIAEDDKKRIEQEKETQQAIKQIQQDGTNFLIGLINNALQIQQSSIETQIQDNQTQADEAVIALDNELATKQISQEVYNQRKAEIDKRAAEEEAKLRRRAFESQKQAAYIAAIISTAQGVANALTVTPAQLVPAYIAIALATGGAQLATIAAQPTPKFEKGGVIGGKRHSQGGTIIEAEKDEYVINRKDAIKHFNLVDAINSGNADEFISKHYIAPILKEQQKKYRESKDNAFADSIVNSMLLNSGQFKDGNLLDALKRNRQSDKDNAIYIVKELSKYTRNARSW